MHDKFYSQLLPLSAHILLSLYVCNMVLSFHIFLVHSVTSNLFLSCNVYIAGIYLVLTGPHSVLYYSTKKFFTCILQCTHVMKLVCNGICISPHSKRLCPFTIYVRICNRITKWRCINNYTTALLDGVECLSHIVHFTLCSVQM